MNSNPIDLLSAIRAGHRGFGGHFLQVSPPQTHPGGVMDRGNEVCVKMIQQWSFREKLQTRESE
jgi:hypothetical protein